MDNRKIALIIDDEPAIHLYLQVALKTMGVTALGAETLEKARQILELQKPDLIFIDNYLPDGMGIENISQIQESSPNSTIIAMTSQHSSEWKKRALNKGAKYFLEKPFSMIQLHQFVESSVNA